MIGNLKYMKRTMSLETNNKVGETVLLCGWIHRRRDMGNLVFLDLRDLDGMVQVVISPNDLDKDVAKNVSKLRPEYVIKVEGEVKKRDNDQINKESATGKVEILVKNLEILNEAKTPPFEIDKDSMSVSENKRLKYRYLDLRTERMKKNILGRHKIVQATREFLNSKGFIDIETPILLKGTPEGAREFLVPARKHPGKFYVLPQSPQQVKQMLMVAGYEKYYQIARVFRDEDPRGDRQFEFTQIDMEMAFVEQEDVMNLTEELCINVTQKVTPNKEIMFKPFKRFTYEEAMNLYGSDKPDLRFELPMSDVSEEVKGCNFNVFSETVDHGGVVKALKVDGKAGFSRKEIDALEQVAKINHAKGLANFKITDKGAEGSIVQHIGEVYVNKIIEKTQAKTGDIIFFTADEWVTACESIGAVRIELANKLNLIDENKLCYLWVTDFPMFTANKSGEEKGYGDIAAKHHPFTRVKDEDLHLLDSEPLKARAYAYDLVLNGYEVGGGSIRIHKKELQKKIFDLLNISDDEAEFQFGHMLKAFEYGAPPHGGIAPGLDRWTMILMNEPNIREVIAFPKTGDAQDLMFGAPTEMPKERLDEVHIEIRKLKS